MWQAVGLRPCEFPACLLVTSGWQPHCAMEVSQLLLAGSASPGFHHDRCVGGQEVGKGRQVHESLALPPSQMVVTSPQLPHCWSLSPPSWGLAEMGAGYSGRNVVSALPLPSQRPPHEACSLTTLPQPCQLGLQAAEDAGCQTASQSSSQACSDTPTFRGTDARISQTYLYIEQRILCWIMSNLL